MSAHANTVPAGMRPSEARPPAVDPGRSPQGAQQPSRSPEYWIRRHVYFCETEDGVIFLDLKRDQYLGLAAKSAAVLPLVLRGWSSSGPYTEPPAMSSADEVDATIKLLTRRDLVCGDEGEGKPAVPVAVPAVDMIRPGQTLMMRPRIRFSHVVRFCLACIRAALALRGRRLDLVVASVRSSYRTSSSSSRFEAAAAIELTEVFRRLRAFAFSEKDKCLLNALALIYFLALYGQFPMWVIGVKSGPFGAHSWVQHGGLVLDCDPKHASYFTPILVV